MKWTEPCSSWNEVWVKKVVMNAYFTKFWKRITKLIAQKVKADVVLSDGSLLKAALPLFFFQVTRLKMQRNKCASLRSDGEPANIEWDPLLFWCSPSIDQQGAAFYFHSHPVLAAVETDLHWTWSLCVCVCVSLMATFQVVRPNELIANGNWGLKCNRISRFLLSLKGGSGERTGGWARRHPDILLCIIFETPG